jgi:hypothetical protein
VERETRSARRWETRLSTKGTLAVSFDQLISSFVRSRRGLRPAEKGHATYAAGAIVFGRERSKMRFRDRSGRAVWFFVVAVALFIFLGHAPEAWARSQQSGGRLIVQRAANFGTDLVIRLSIDGKRVANIPIAHRYEGNLSAGRHRVTLEVLPNTEFREPSTTSVTIQSGRTHIFTAGWDRDRLGLRRSTVSVPATAAY